MNWYKIAQVPGFAYGYWIDINGNPIGVEIEEHFNKMEEMGYIYNEKESKDQGTRYMSIYKAGYIKSALYNNEANFAWAEEISPNPAQKYSMIKLVKQLAQYTNMFITIYVDIHQFIKDGKPSGVKSHQFNTLPEFASFLSTQ
jgi:hypothetical protein